MKKTKFFAAILAAVLLIATLTACGGENSGKEPPITEGTEISETSEVPETTGTSETQEEEMSEYAVEILGYTLDLETAELSDGDPYNATYASLTPEEAFLRHQSDVETYQAYWSNEFAFTRKSMGVGYNSIDDPDFVNTETFELNVDPLPENTNELIKISVGDVIDGLTVTGTSFSYRHNATGETAIDKQYTTSFALDGEVTLTGYIGVACEEEGYIQSGDIFFYPDPEMAEKLPFSASTFEEPVSLTWLNDFYIYTDIPRFTLGSIYGEMYQDVDISAIPNDGTMNHVEIKLTDVGFSTPHIRELMVTARIVEIN